MKIQKRVQKLITFSPQSYQLAQKRAGQLGLSFSEYIRYILTSAIESAENRLNDLPMVDEETEQRLAGSWQAYKKGEYVKVNAGDEKSLNKALGII